MKKGCHNCYKGRNHCWRWYRHWYGPFDEPTYCSEWKWSFVVCMIPISIVVAVCSMAIALIVRATA